MDFRVLISAREAIEGDISPHDLNQETVEHPSPDRDVSEWVLQNLDTVEVESIGQLIWISEKNGDDYRNTDEVFVDRDLQDMEEGDRVLIKMEDLRENEEFVAEGVLDGYPIEAYSFGDGYIERMGLDLIYHDFPSFMKNWDRVTLHKSIRVT